MKTITAYFKNHEPVNYTDGSLELLKTDTAVEQIIDAGTGEILFARERNADQVTADILTYFEENEDTFTDIIEQLDGWDGYLGDDRVEDMENLYEYYRDDLENFALRMYYGHDADDWTTDQWGEKHFSAFCPNRNYFYYNGYGNLISTDYKDYTDKLDKYFIDEVLENRSHLYIGDSELDDLLDALEQARTAE